jgi:hypothetical protein
MSKAGAADCVGYVATAALLECTIEDFDRSMNINSLGGNSGATAFCADSAAITFNGLLAVLESGPGSHPSQ